MWDLGDGLVVKRREISSHFRFVFQHALCKMQTAFW